MALNRRQFLKIGTFGIAAALTSVFVIAADGTILGTHRKINTLRVGAEA